MSELLPTEKKSPIRDLVKVVDLGGPTARVVLNEYYRTSKGETWICARLAIMTPAMTCDGVHTPASSIEVSLDEKQTEALINALRATS